MRKPHTYSLAEIKKRLNSGKHTEFDVPSESEGDMWEYLNSLGRFMITTNAWSPDEKTDLVRFIVDP